MILEVLITMVAGWLQRHQQHVIAYLQEENRLLKAQLGGRPLRLTDTGADALLLWLIRSVASASKRWRPSPPPRPSCGGTSD